MDNIVKLWKELDHALIKGLKVLYFAFDQIVGKCIYSC